MTLHVDWKLIALLIVLALWLARQRPAPEPEAAATPADLDAWLAELERRRDSERISDPDAQRTA